MPPQFNQMFDFSITLSPKLLHRPIVYSVYFNDYSWTWTLLCDWLQVGVASSWIILCLHNIMLIRSARVVQVLQDSLHVVWQM